MAKKTAKKEKPKKKAKPFPEEYNRNFIVETLVDVVASESGIAKLGAIKEIRSMLSEETPDGEIDIDIHYVPITFDGEKFHADKSKGVKI